MGAFHYTIQIDDIYLSRDGTGATTNAKVLVEGVDRLQSSYTKNIQKDFRNNPIILKTNVGVAGREIVIDIPVIYKPVAELLIALHQASEENDTVIRLIGTDATTPDFDLYVLPGEPGYEFKDYSKPSNAYLNSKLRYISVGDISLFWDTERLAWDGDTLLWS